MEGFVNELALISVDTIQMSGEKQENFLGKGNSVKKGLEGLKIVCHSLTRAGFCGAAERRKIVDLVEGTLLGHCGKVIDRTVKRHGRR